MSPIINGFQKKKYKNNNDKWTVSDTTRKKAHANAIQY